LRIAFQQINDILAAYASFLGGSQCDNAIFLLVSGSLTRGLIAAFAKRDNKFVWTRFKFGVRRTLRAAGISHPYRAGSPFLNKLCIVDRLRDSRISRKRIMLVEQIADRKSFRQAARVADDKTVVVNTDLNASRSAWLIIDAEPV